MSRLGTNMNASSDQMEAKFLPDMEGAKPEEGAAVDLTGDGQHKIYMHRGQLEVYNFGSRHTKLRCARGWGKTSYLGFYNMKCVLGLRRQMGLFLGASAKQLMCRTMPNMLKVFNLLGFTEGVYYFRGQAPAKLRWETPLAKPRVWENVIHFQNGACIMGASLAVKGSCNGINAAWLSGDETKYMRWSQVKEEAFPTLRGDFMPPAARKTELKHWGYGTDPKTNPYYCSSCFCSDAGLTQAQSEWERDGEESQTAEVNERIADLLSKLRYLEKHNPQLAVELARNEAFLKELHLLRSQSESYWNFSSVDNISLLSIEWLRQMKRSLPDLMWRIQICGQKKGAAKDGFYSNFDPLLHTYTSDQEGFCVGSDTYTLIADRFTQKVRGKAPDIQNYWTEYETESINYEQAQAAAADGSLDTDLDFTAPLQIAVDCNANINCMVVGQERTINGQPSLLILASLFVQNERKLRSLCHDFTARFRSHLRRNGNVIFRYATSIKQGGSVAYAVEGADEFRFDRVVEAELKSLGWKVESVEMTSARHMEKYTIINDILSFKTTPHLYINSESGRNDYLLVAIDNCGVLPNGKKDKSREKLKATDEDSLGGDPRTRSDITDALDDLLLSVKFHDTLRPKIGGGLRGRFQHLAGIPRH
ncbi:MAG: hypothetical protein IJ570_00910 [Prevotella sp.]|nr:hypothetical protein [Prevotella sp.]